MEFVRVLSGTYLQPDKIILSNDGEQSTRRSNISFVGETAVNADVIMGFPSACP